MLRQQKNMSYGSTDDEEFRVLVIGKSGNGRSALCNAILGENKFPVGRGLASTTTTTQMHTAFKDGGKIKVIDTPDIINCGMSPQQQKDEVSKWRQSRPSAVVLTVRCDVRYTAEEYDIYREIVRLWGDNSIQDNLVVAFTFGDLQDDPIEEELKMVCHELKNVLKDAGQRYFVFNNRNKENREEAASIVKKTVAQKKQRGGKWEEENFPIIFAVFIALTLIAGIACVVFVMLHDVNGVTVCGVVAGVFLLVLLSMECWKRLNRY